MSSSISPFSIAIFEEVLDDLRDRLRRTRWPDNVENPGGIYGIDLQWLKELQTYWSEVFDWRRVEVELNIFPNYLYDYGEGKIHFLHIHGSGPNPMPLLFTHGWPGSVYEALKLIPLLTDPTAFGADPNDSFDVIVPSIPGFGFSSPPKKPGMNLFAIADLWADLMSQLGYKKFVAQGGDFGAGVSTALGLLHSERIFGLHLNYIPGSYRPFVELGEMLSSEEMAYLNAADKWYEESGAYAHVQRNDPQTLSIGLNDSPMGLASWIVDKFQRWSDCDGVVEKAFNMRELLMHVTLFWITQSIGSSCRLYNEVRRAPLHFRREERVRVPCSIAHFPKEAPFPPRSWIERGYNVTRWTEMKSGGHFAAMEEPLLLAKDLRSFCRPMRTALRRLAS